MGRAFRDSRQCALSRMLRRWTPGGHRAVPPWRAWIRFPQLSPGAGSFYDKVYSAERPELFLKATPHRVAGPGERVCIRRDSRWNVPEPELTLVISPKLKLVGYTIGNDMSSRDIEGENPLYLPQA